MAEFQHFDSSDPRHVTRGETYTLRQWSCVTCQATATTYGDGSPWCGSCQAYSMRESGRIEDTKVAEIKSRKAPEAERTRKGKMDRFQDNLVSEMKAIVRPRSGANSLLISVNMDGSAFMRGQAFVKWGNVSFITSVEEIGGAFAPFDPTPSMVTVGGSEIRMERKAVKGSTRIGPVSVLGGQSRKRFDDGWVTFRHGSQTATFDMHDIAQVLKYAL